MNHSTNTYSISNEQSLLINILNGMYYDNLSQINNLTNANSQIRNLLIQMLHNPNRRNNSNSNSNSNNNSNNNSNSRSQRNNNTPIFTDRNELGRTSTSYIVDDYSISGTQPNNNNNRSSRNRSETSNTLFSQLLQTFFQPIDVFPTQIQVENAIRLVRYSDIVSPLNRSCPISLENFRDTDMVSVIRHCGHIFNTDHIHTWFSSNCRCPVCRYDIRNYILPTSSEILRDSIPTNNTNTNTNNTNTNNSTLLNSIFVNPNIADISNNLINNISDQSELLRILNEFQWNNST